MHFQVFLKFLCLVPIFFFRHFMVIIFFKRVLQNKRNECRSQIKGYEIVREGMYKQNRHSHKVKLLSGYMPNWYCQITGSWHSKLERMQRHAVQHKCLPHLACKRPTPLLFWKNCKFYKKLFRNLKKGSHQFVELIESNPLIYNIFHFHQYSRFSIWIFFGFQPKFSKTNLKFENVFHKFICRACWDESIDIQHIAIWSIFTPLYSFEYKFFGFQTKFSVFSQKFFFNKILKTKFKFEKKCFIIL